MALAMEQYTDTLVRIARIQQKLQSYYLLPIAMQLELEEKNARSVNVKTIHNVDKLKSNAADPSEVKSLRSELRKLQRDTKEFERTSSFSSSGKIRMLNEKLTLTQRLNASIDRGNELRRTLNELQPGGFRSLFNRIIHRQKIAELQSGILRNEREVSILRLAAPRPRQVKTIKKALQNAFDEKLEKEIKRDIREMRREVHLYDQVQRDKDMLHHYKELANKRGFSLLRLSFQHLKEHLKGNSIIQREQRVEAARSPRLANKEDGNKRATIWQAIFRPQSLYTEQVNELKQRLALYENVPTKAQAERLQVEIKQWSRELEKRLKQREQGKPFQPQQPQQVREQHQENQVHHEQKQSQREIKPHTILVRLQDNELAKLQEANISYTVKENQANSYEIVEGQNVSEKVYQGVQIQLSSNDLNRVEELLNRSFATDPEVGTIKYSALKQEKEKIVLIKNVPPEKIALLQEQNAPFTSFQKGKNYNVYCRKSDFERVQKMLESSKPVNSVVRFPNERQMAR